MAVLSLEPTHTTLYAHGSTKGLSRQCVLELTQSRAAVQDLHESTTVNSLERMASCTLRALSCHGQPHVFARAQQPDLTVEVCMKQRTGIFPEV